VKLRWDATENRLVMYRKRKRVGDIEHVRGWGFAVLHYATDLSWDSVDTLPQAVQLLLDTDNEHRSART
jgi:hypothetical protein